MRKKICQEFLIALEDNSKNLMNGVNIAEANLRMQTLDRIKMISAHYSRWIFTATPRSLRWTRAFDYLEVSAIQGPPFCD